jgi:hypothetical protein
MENENDVASANASELDPDRNARYAGIIQLICNAEQVSWNRFYSLLTGNAILILAWASLINVDSIRVKVGLTCVCALGVLMGIIWAILGHRGRRFLAYYMHWGKRVETEPKYVPKPLELSERLRDRVEKLGDGNDPQFAVKKSVCEYIYNLCGSRMILILMPILFSLLFSVMLIITWVGK